jgi:hypothetical protein
MCGTKTKTEIVLIYFLELAPKVLHKKLRTAQHSFLPISTWDIFTQRFGCL